jgi:predicted ATPase
MAETHGKVGQVEDGLENLAEALDLVQSTGEREHEAELYRLRGELTLKQSRFASPDFADQEEAEQCFHSAIDIARKQQAKSLELRAATSLARLWQQQGKQKEAHGTLAEICGWFTEGFDTTDLIDAKALLDELAS